MGVGDASTVRLLRFLLSRVNPTWGWEDDPTLTPLVNLDRHCFSSIATGDPIERLFFLGRGKVTRFGLAWPRKGIEVSVNDGRIGEIGIYFGHSAEADFGEFIGTIQFGGAPVHLTRETREAEILSLFGKPYWRDQDDDEIILFYEFPEREWQVEFDLNGTLKYLSVGAQLMADEGQREEYKVTAPWPPDYT
jgi:hypothetical protein